MSSFLGFSDYDPLPSSKSPTRGFATRVRNHRAEAESFDAREMAKLTSLSEAQTRSAIAGLLKSGELVVEKPPLTRYRWKK